MRVEEALKTIAALTSQELRGMSRTEYQEACRKVREILKDADIDALYDSGGPKDTELAEELMTAHRMFVPRPAPVSVEGSRVKAYQHAKALRMLFTPA